MKLELKHLAGYLPYKLQIEDYEPKFMIFDLTGANIEYVIHYKTKPILRPLSDLTKEIEVNGEKFVPYENLSAHFEVEYYGNMLHKNVEKLLEWHFDVFGLIENGLAIDINTLKK